LAANGTKESKVALILHGRHTSYNVQKVLWLLDELGVSYQHIELGSKPNDTETKEFGALNPMRKVPVLVDGDKVIWESNTILRYLTDEYGAGIWSVKDPYQRSLYERWMDWSHTYFEPVFIGVFWGYYRTPAAQRDMEAVNKNLTLCLKGLERLDEQLASNTYLTGEQISLADICAGVFMYRLVEIDLGVILPTHVQRWYEQLQDSAGFQKWAMSDFSSLENRLQY
jgi:glutathione S-transferase